MRGTGFQPVNLSSHSLEGCATKAAPLAARGVSGRLLSMSEPQPELIATPPARPRAGHAIAHVSFDFFFALGCTLLCRAMTGATLGFLFAPVLLATIFTPPLILAHPKTRLRVVAWLTIAIGVSIGWLLFAGLRPSESFRCIFVLTAYLLALAGLASLLNTFGITELLASAIVTIFALLWLTWPIWLSRALTSSHGDALVGWLSPAHPLLAINGVVRARFDAWDRYQMAYQQLTTLNQDVIYRLPAGIALAVLFHLAVGALSMMSAVFAKTLAAKRRSRIDMPRG